MVVTWDRIAGVSHVLRSGDPDFAEAHVVRMESPPWRLFAHPHARGGCGSVPRRTSRHS